MYVWENKSCYIYCYLSFVKCVWKLIQHNLCTGIDNTVADIYWYNASIIFQKIIVLLLHKPRRFIFTSIQVLNRNKYIVIALNYIVIYLYGRPANATGVNILSYTPYVKRLSSDPTRIVWHFNNFLRISFCSTIKRSNFNRYK